MNYIDNILNKVITSKNGIFYLFFFVLVLLTLLMMYFYSPLLPGHDFHFHLLRFQALMNALADGNFYPSYVDYHSAAGYGYFTKAFYSDVILIPFAIVGCFTSLLFGYQLLIFTITILCGLFTYKAVNSILKNPLAAMFAALLYTFCVYRLLDVYNRSALGEAISFTFVPLVFLGLYHVIKGDYRKWYILSIGFSLMIFTHLISSVLLFLTILLFLLIYNKYLRQEPQRLGYLVLSGFVTVLITAYYIFPMLEQMLSNSFYYETRDISKPVEYGAYKFHWTIWGMFTGIVQPRQIFIPGVGILLTISVLLRLFIYEKSKELKLMDTLSIVGLIYIFATSSLFPWGYFPFTLLDFIQLPWRLYEFASFFLAIAGGYYLAVLLKTNKRRLIGLCGIVGLIVVMLVSESILYKETRNVMPLHLEPTSNNDYLLSGLEYFPDKFASVAYIQQRGDTIISNNPAVVSTNLVRAKGVTQFDVETNTSAILELPLTYYKGYQAQTSSGSYLPISESENGLVQIEVDQSGQIEVYYGGTWVQKVGWFVSILSILSLCLFIFYQKKSEKLKQI